MYTISYYDLNSTSGLELLYSPDKVDDGYVVSSATFTIEIDKAGEASFTIPYSHPCYNSIGKLRTMIAIKDDDKIVWFGRVFGIKRDFYNNKQITCEGALTFLNDICLMPFRYYVKDQIKPVNKSDHLNYIMALYNKRCSKRRKAEVSVFGEIIASESTISGTESFNTIFQEIQDKIIEDYDYSILTSYTVNEGNIIPIFNIGRLPFSNCSQTIEFGKNLIFFEDYISADELYSCAIPVGSGNISIFSDDNQDDIYSIVPIEDRNYYLTTGLESSCGVIDKVINFDGIEDRTVLRTTGEKILELGGGVTESVFTINAVDLHLLDVNTEKINVGAKIRVISSPHKIDSDFVCLKTEIDMLKPEANKYTFSIANVKTSEKLTNKIQNDTEQNRKEMNKKMNLNQQYGVVRISNDGASIVLSKEDDDVDQN